MAKAKLVAKPKCTRVPAATRPRATGIVLKSHLLTFLKRKYQSELREKFNVTIVSNALQNGDREVFLVSDGEKSKLKKAKVFIRNAISLREKTPRKLKSPIEQEETSLVVDKSLNIEENSAADSSNSTADTLKKSLSEPPGPKLDSSPLTFAEQSAGENIVLKPQFFRFLKGILQSELRCRLGVEIDSTTLPCGKCQVTLAGTTEKHKLMEAMALIRNAIKMTEKSWENIQQKLASPERKEDTSIVILDESPNIEQNSAADTLNKNETGDTPQKTLNSTGDTQKKTLNSTAGTPSTSNSTGDTQKKTLNSTAGTPSTSNSTGDTQKKTLNSTAGTPSTSNSTGDTQKKTLNSTAGTPSTLNSTGDTQKKTLNSTADIPSTSNSTADSTKKTLNSSTNTPRKTLNSAGDATKKILLDSPGIELVCEGDPEDGLCPVIMDTHSGAGPSNYVVTVSPMYHRRNTSGTADTACNGGEDFIPTTSRKSVPDREKSADDTIVLGEDTILISSGEESEDDVQIERVIKSKSQSPKKAKRKSLGRSSSAGATRVTTPKVTKRKLKNIVSPLQRSTKISKKNENSDVSFIGVTQLAVNPCHQTKAQTRSVKSSCGGKIRNIAPFNNQLETRNNAGPSSSGVKYAFNQNIVAPDSESVKKTGLRPVIIDARNVASEKGLFNFSKLDICIKYFRDRNHRVIALLPRHLQGVIQGADRLRMEVLEEEQILCYTPSRKIPGGKRYASYDDRYIVQAAHELGGVIVSNDNYRDLMAENSEWKETIENRLLMFTWIGNMLMFPNDPMGRDGPHLEEFLRFPKDGE